MAFDKAEAVIIQSGSSPGRARCDALEGGPGRSSADTFLFPCASCRDEQTDPRRELNSGGQPIVRAFCLAARRETLQRFSGAEGMPPVMVHTG